MQDQNNKPRNPRGAGRKPRIVEKLQIEISEHAAPLLRQGGDEALRLLIRIIQGAEVDATLADRIKAATEILKRTMPVSLYEAAFAAYVEALNTDDTDSSGSVYRTEYQVSFPHAVAVGHPAIQGNASLPSGNPGQEKREDNNGG